MEERKAMARKGREAIVGQEEALHGLGLDCAHVLGRTAEQPPLVTGACARVKLGAYTHDAVRVSSPLWRRQQTPHQGRHWDTPGLTGSVWPLGSSMTTGTKMCHPSMVVKLYWNSTHTPTFLFMGSCTQVSVLAWSPVPLVPATQGSCHGRGTHCSLQKQIKQPAHKLYALSSRSVRPHGSSSLGQASDTL